MATKEAAKEGRYEPAWHAEFRRLYASNSVFVLHGNVQDYVTAGMRLPDYLAESMRIREFGIVVFYDRARGITFATPLMERRARKILDMQTPEPGEDPTAALATMLGNKPGKAANEPPEFPRSLSGALPLLEKLLKSDPGLYYPSRRPVTGVNAPTLYDTRNWAKDVALERDETEVVGCKTAVILLYGEHVAPSQDVGAMPPEDRVAQIILRGWGTDPVIPRRGSIAFLVADTLTDVSPAVRNSWRTLKIALPDLRERLIFLRSFSDGWQVKGFTNWICCWQQG